MPKKGRQGYRLLLLSFLMLFTTVFSGGSQAYAATWNLTGDTNVHDPSYIKEGNTHWVFSTGSGLQVMFSNDGTNYIRSLPIYTSKPSWWSSYVPNQEGLDVWAPEIFYYNGTYYLYYSISTFGSRVSAIGLVTTKSISGGKWTDQGVVISSNDASNYNAIDPNITADANGNLWMTFGSWSNGIYITSINKTTMKPTGNSYRIATKSGGIEGSSMVYNPNTGYYYLFVSIGQCCSGVNSTYKIAVGRSTSVLGPFYAKDGTDMKNGGATVIDSGNSFWAGPGGQDIYGTNVIVRHAYSVAENGAPKLLISDLEWDSAGWPYYN
ncbi:glycoside hydrolase family 43 protein [Paenibacillus odorifer]|uniref:glycoside hydrolase family 43 protein n=1 Tax=Paenibacillus odorifer TaxID=189426 RepID=UPI00096C6DA8|nr:glycoside hydrolase family 43 protein [Paenibacillus odorifer]OME50525.1 arabinan endo-1,5-alpha-L-arabinosidase [Paenibacillus odorifer]